MAITPINGDLTAGLPGKRSETINAAPDPYITGDVPPRMSDAFPMAADQVLAAHQIVALDASGHLIAAAEADGAPKAIGITVYAADSTGQAAGAMMTAVDVWGCFNPDLIVWPASFNTAELKRSAFRGAPSPTNIIIRRPTTMTV